MEVPNPDTGGDPQIPLQQEVPEHMQGSNPSWTLLLHSPAI